MAKTTKKAEPKAPSASLEGVRMKLDDVMADLDTLAASAVYPQRYKNAKRQIQNVCRNSLKA